MPVPKGMILDGQDTSKSAEPMQPGEPSTLQKFGDVAGDVLKGVGKGALHTLDSTDDWARAHLPAFFTNTKMGFGPPADLAKEHAREVPHNTAQNVGRGLEQAGEFMIPGGAEESATAHLAPMIAKIPKMAKAAPVLAKMATAAVGSGLVNKAQGGDFGTGAATGAIGSGIGQGVQAAAPSVVGWAQGVGRRTGKAILDETTGILPSSIRASAARAKNAIGSQLDNVMRSAGERPPASVRGLLQAPEYDVPLHTSPDVPGIPSRPIVLHQPNRPMRPALPAPKSEIPLTENPYFSRLPPNEGVANAEINTSRVGEPMSTPEGNPNYGYSDQFPSSEGKWTGGTLLRPFDGGEASGMGHGQYFGQIPGEQGGPGEVQGVLRTRDPLVHGQAPEPGKEIPYRGMSLSPYRSMVQDEVGKANLQGNVKLAKGLTKIDENTLANRGLAGPRPETVSPFEFWQTKRGVGDAVSATKWRPGYSDPFANVQKRVYGAMSDAMHKAVPESVPLDSRYSALADATKVPGKSLFGHAAGPVAGATLGGIGGYEAGGASGAVKGAAAGALLPFAAPAALNLAARVAYSPAGQRLVPFMAGAGLQLNRPDISDQQVVAPDDSKGVQMVKLPVVKKKEN